MSSPRPKPNVVRDRELVKTYGYYHRKCSFPIPNTICVCGGEAEQIPHHIIYGSGKHSDEGWNLFPLCSYHHRLAHGTVKKEERMKKENIVLMLLEQKIRMGEASLRDILDAQWRFEFKW